MVTERTIINALIIGATTVLAPFAISSMLGYDYLPMLVFGVLGVLFVGLFYSRDRLSVWPVIGLGITGSLNFLPVPLFPYQIFCIILILYFVANNVVLKQKPVRLGRANFFWPILIIFLIVLYHNHSLHLHSMGDENTEGDKPVIFAYLGIIAFFCGINIPPPSPSFLEKVPLYYTVLYFVSSIPFALTTFYPGLAPYLYVITDTVNVEAYQISQASGASSGISRLSAFGGAGIALQLYLVSRYPVGTWVRPGRWWVMALSIVATVLTVVSGYRNYFFSFATITVVGIFCYYSWRTFFFVATFFIALVMLFCAAGDGLVHLPLNKLPLIAQRTLSFLPGDWDEEALETAKSSNDFRLNIQNVYIDEYMAKSPWIGSGFNIDAKEFNGWNQANKSVHGFDSKYAEAKLYIEGKMFHTGWISVYDIVGVIGAGAFIALGLNAIGVAGYFVFGPTADRRSSLFPLYVWLTCSTVSLMATFFAVFGDFGYTFPILCMYGIILSQLSDLRRSNEAPVPHLSFKEERRELLRSQ